MGSFRQLRVLATSIVAWFVFWIILFLRSGIGAEARGSERESITAAWRFGLVASVVVAVIASLIVERFTFRYLKTRYGDSTEHAIPLVSSLGFLLILENLVRIEHGSDAQRFPGPSADLTLSLAGIHLSRYSLQQAKGSTSASSAGARGEPRS